MSEHRPGSLVSSGRMTWLNPRYWFQRLVRLVNGRTIRADGPDQPFKPSSCYERGLPNVANDNTSAVPTVSTHNIAWDLENALGLPVAVEVEVVSVDKVIGAQSDNRNGSRSNADTIMAVVITRREHATILAALRYVAGRGGFEDTAEVGIATDIDQWKAMSPDEIDELGDRFNAGSGPMHNVCRCCEGRG